jgi:hypothetical protein
MRNHKQNTAEISESQDFIDLDWRELLLYFYKKSEEHYKDITETENYMKHKNG